MSSPVFQRNLDFAPTASIDKVDLNNKVVMMRAVVKRAKLHMINGLVKKIHKLRNKKGTEEQQVWNKSKADRLLEEVKVIKVLKPDYVAKYALGSIEKFEQLVMKPSTTIDIRALSRLSQQKFIQDVVTKFRSEHEDWRDLAAYLMTKHTSRDFKKKKTKKKMKTVETNVKALDTLVQTYLDEKLDGRHDIEHDDEDKGNWKNEESNETGSSLYIGSDDDKDNRKQRKQREIEPDASTESFLGKYGNKNVNDTDLKCQKVQSNTKYSQLGDMENDFQGDNDGDADGDDDDDAANSVGNNSSNDNDSDSHSELSSHSDGETSKKSCLDTPSRRLTVSNTKQMKREVKKDIAKKLTESDLKVDNLNKTDNDIVKRKGKDALKEKIEGEMIVKKLDLEKDFTKDEIPTILLGHSEGKPAKQKKKTKDLFFDMGEGDASEAQDSEMIEVNDSGEFDGRDCNTSDKKERPEGSIQPTMSAFSTTFVGSLNSSKMMSCQDGQFRSNEDWKRIRHENKEQKMGSGRGSNASFSRGRAGGPSFRGRGFSNRGSQGGRGYSQGRGSGSKSFRGHSSDGWNSQMDRYQKGHRGHDGGKGESATVSKKPEILHPSWAASKKRKQEQKGLLQVFSGKKVKFDD